MAAVRARYRGAMFALTRFEWLALAAALLLCPRLSFGQEGEGRLFDRLDRNRDGYLSREELAVEQARQGNWIAIDRDRDGRISRSEFNAVLAGPQKPSPPSAATGSTVPPPKEAKE